MSKGRDYRRDDYDYRRDDYRKGSRSYRSEDRRRREDDDNDRSRSRSRDCSPRKSYDRHDSSSNHSPHRSYDHDNSSSYHSQSGKQKIAFGLEKKAPETDLKKSGIQIKLGSNAMKFQKPAPVKKPTVADVFNNSDDDEPEEMPAEARMRMRNIGRDTPTSAGPNSFGKTKQGFCDSKKIFEKSLKKAMEEANK